MPVDAVGEVNLDLPSAMPADTVAVGVADGFVVVALEGRDGLWSAFEATPSDARALAVALLEKIDILESREYAQV